MKVLAQSVTTRTPPRPGNEAQLSSNRRMQSVAGEHIIGFDVIVSCTVQPNLRWILRQTGYSGMHSLDSVSIRFIAHRIHQDRSPDSPPGDHWKEMVNLPCSLPVGDSEQIMSRGIDTQLLE